MFVDFFIRRPVFATVCSLFIILAGAISIPTLPIAEFPDLAPPQVIVSSGYIGANAQTVESAVTIPLEQAINGLANQDLVGPDADQDGIPRPQLIARHRAGGQRLNKEHVERLDAISMPTRASTAACSSATISMFT